MNGEELEWSGWVEEWQRVDAGPVEPSLGRRVQSRSRLLAVWIATEMAIAAIAVAVLTWFAVTSPLAADRIAMGTLAVVCIATAIVALWNWRGTWRPADASQRSFLDVSLLRCHRLRRATISGWWILAVEVLCFVPWIAARSGAIGAAAGTYVRAYLWLAAFVVAAIVFLIAVRRWADREEAAIRDLAASLDAGDEIRPNR